MKALVYPFHLVLPHICKIQNVEIHATIWFLTKRIMAENRQKSSNSPLTLSESHLRFLSNYVKTF